MKHVKRIGSLLLIVAIVLAMSIPALATQEGELTGGSITINDAVPGQTYKAYQLLYLESYNKDAGAYAYKANSAWETWLKTQTTYVSFDDQGYVTWVKDADAAAFAKLAQVEAAKMTADKTETGVAANEGDTSCTVTFSDLKLGYYLIDTTLGTLCSLDTTNPSAEVEEKNEVATVDKEVKEDDATENVWRDDNDADIGQTVEFKTTIHAKKGAQSYVLHDVMSSGLTLNADSIEVKAGTTTLTKDTDYTVSTTNSDNCTFEISFKQTYLDTITTDTDIVVTYSAKLNENAVVGKKDDEKNTNKTKLNYGEESKTETAWDETTTYTWELKVFKYTNVTGDNGTTTKTALKDAKFELRRSDEEGTAAVGLISKGNNVYRIAKSDENSETSDYCTVITTDATGKFEIEGLDSDKYYLVETSAPAGYNVLAGPIKVEIEDDGTVKYYNTVAQGDGTFGYETDAKTAGDDGVEVLNQSGVELPSTGGTGTTMIYIVGAALALLAVVLLVTRRRMSKNHEA